MDQEPAQYIVVRNWERFQHYSDRTPPWIKTYTELLDDEAYRSLSGGQRATLHGLWLAYAKSRRKLPESTSDLSQRLGLRVTKRTLAALNHAGFIDIVASTALAACYQDASASRAREEKDKEEIPPLPPTSGGTSSRANGTNPRALRKATRPERQARQWIANGLADEIPSDHLGEVIADEFGLDDAELVAALVEITRERRQ